MYLDNFKWAPAKQDDPFRYVLCTTISRLDCQHLSKASREISSFLSQKIRGSLRENEKQDDDYSIPYDNCFDYVSSLHYLAEIISLSSISSSCITSPITSTIPCICVSYLLLFLFFIPNLEVIYVGVAITSGWLNVTIWLLFVFVVSLDYFWVKNLHIYF